MKTSEFFKKTLLGLCIGMMLVGLIGCSQSKETAAPEASQSAELSLPDLEKAAQKEGTVVSVGMPDAWANWKGTWTDLAGKYGLKHQDTDMSSTEEVAKFEAEKSNPTADIGDVGIAFGPLAVQKGVTQPYKTSYWNDIPDWAKDKEGHWIVQYQGTMAIMTDKSQVKNLPRSYDDILKGDYKVALGDVTKANQAQMAVLAAAMALGGDESNIQPGLDFFVKLVKQGRLSKTDTQPANFEKGEIAVGLVWDFNALGYRDQIAPQRFEVCIPSEGSVISGYASIINKFAPHPNAAKLTREYIFSDAGQINLARGYARPIRSNVNLPQDVAAKLLPAEQYKSGKIIKDQKAWEATSKKLPQMWQDQVLSLLK